MSKKSNSSSALSPLLSPKAIHNPHDKLFKRALANIEIAKDFFDIHLPDDMKAHCDLNTLALSHDSYVEDNYKEHFSDVIYHMSIDGNPGYIYCVVEHLSKAEILTPFQVLRYQIAIMDQHIERLPKKERKQARLPVVMPLIFYRGPKSPYPGSTNIWSCFENPEFAHRTLLNSIALIDLSVIPDEELKTHRSVALLELLQKHIDDRENFEKIFQEWLEQDKLHEYIGVNLFKLMITYTLQLTRPDDPQTLIQAIENSTISEEYKETMQTVAQYLQQQGMQEGVLLGEYQRNRDNAKKMLAKGIDRATVKEITNLSDVELDTL